MDVAHGGACRHRSLCNNLVEADDAYLEHLGYKPEFKRDSSFIGLFSLVQSELAVFPGVARTIWCGHTIVARREA